MDSLLNSFSEYNNGGTHEQNPNNGIQIGYGANGKKNLVEEGETKYDDYVYSNRLSIDSKEMVDAFLLPKNSNNKSFAEASKKIMEESKERPNDSIAIRGAREMLARLAKAQEEKKKVREMYARQIQEDIKARESEAIRATIEQLYNSNPELVEEMLSRINPNQGTIEEVNTFSQGGDTVPLTSIPVTMPDISVALPKISSLPTIKVPSIQEPAYIDGFNATINRDAKLGNLRYANPVFSGLQVLSDIAGLSNKDDFSEIDRMQKNAQSLLNKGLLPTPGVIGRKITPTLMDINYLSNQIQANSSATRRAILNSGLTNAGITAGLLSNSYNTNNNLGQAYRQALEYNAAQKSQATQYNNELDYRNAQLQQSAQAQNINTYYRMAELQKTIAEARMKERLANDTARATNRAALLQNISNLGIEAYNRVRANQRAGGKYYDNGSRIVYNPATLP